MNGSHVSTSNKSQPVSDVLAMASANTEYSYAFPKGVRYALFKLRSTNIPLFMSYATGNVPSGVGGAYMTVPAGSTKEIDFINSANGQTIYFSTGSASQVLEIEYWT